MSKKQTITLQASGNDFTVKTESHSNKMKFTATVMYLDQYSDGVPDGSVWEKILLEKSECEKSLETMNLMGINCVWDEWGKANWQFDGHDPRNKIGVVENTYIEGNELKIDGIIYKRDFSDISQFIRNTMESMGFSIEASFNDWEETEEGLIIRDVEFTGVSMLFKNCAAYSDTYIETLSASKKDKEIMTQEERNTFMEEVTNSIMAKINEVQEQEKQASELEALKAQIETLQASNKALEEENNSLKANAKTVEAKSKEEPSKEKEEEPKEDVKASTVTSDLKTKAKFVEASNVKYDNYGAMINAFIKSING
ncbi:hypothetical protein [Veillonella sp. 3310]|uniref:hypothetical protein n=1 Tax=Veillonella sp. 3310 TaxID=2490956 RepID=UPI000FD62229|nr:hypothetical protein [Veillonella sp. 3310]